jgi:hypothetical protein
MQKKTKRLEAQKKLYKGHLLQIGQHLVPATLFFGKKNRI